MRAYILSVIALTACSGAGPGSPMGEADDMAVATWDGSAPALALEGRIIGLDKQPLSGVTVSLCQGACRDTLTGPQGEFSFSSVTFTFYTLHVRKPGSADYADLDFPLYLSSGSNPRLLPLVLPKVGAQSPLSPGSQNFAVDAALSLSLDGSALTLPQGGSATALGGVRIPQDLYPNFCVPSARVLAMWAFTPTGVTTTSAISVQISESLGLAPGTNVNLIEINPQDGHPAVVASGAVSPDGKSIATTMGSGLHTLSWLLVAVYQGGA